MTYTRGRATTYKGIRMRSRLEATFAAWLDDAQVEWVYEPNCFADSAGQYLPDFRTTADGANYYTEVKPPTADTSAALLKMHIIRASEPEASLIVVVPAGVYPHQEFITAGRCLPLEKCAHCRGETFRDNRTIPGVDRGVRVYRTPPTHPVAGRIAVGGRPRVCGRCNCEPCGCREIVETALAGYVDPNPPWWRA